MRSTNFKLRSILMGIVTLCLFAGSFQMALAQQPEPERDVLAPLKRALNDAGAAALTADQEAQLESLVTAFRMNRGPQERNETLQAAQRAFDDAVLARDLEAAEAQANIIAGQLAANAEARLQAEAEFKIQVLNILTEGQTNALLERLGTAGVSRVLSALAGGGGFGPGRGGDGRDPRPGGQGRTFNPRRR